MDEDVFFDLLFPKEEKPSVKPVPDFAYLAQELSRKGVTSSSSTKSTRGTTPKATSGSSSIISITPGVRKPIPLLCRPAFS
jgi:hypothetical protein